MAGHTSIVTMQLLSFGKLHEVAQSGGDFLILNEPAAIAKGTAKFFVSIDGDRKVFPLRVTEFVDGIKVPVAQAQESTIPVPHAAAAAE